MKPGVNMNAADPALLEQRPLARRRRLVVEGADGETLVYDQRHDRAHCLNPAATAVWRASDGNTTVTDITRRMSREGLPADEAVVWMALARLQDADLLESPLRLPTPERSFSRKEVLRVLGQAAGITLLLPAVISITAPLAAQAASCVPLASCTNTSGCANSLPICENRRVCCKHRGRRKCRVVAC